MTPRFTALVFALALSAHAVPGSAADCEPSRWGPDDQVGNANLITPQSVLAASTLIKTGKTYSLGVE